MIVSPSYIRGGVCCHVNFKNYEEMRVLLDSLNSYKA